MTKQPAIKQLDQKTLHEIHADTLNTGDNGKPLLIGIDGNEANVKQRVGSNMVAFKLLHSLKKMTEVATHPSSSASWRMKVPSQEGIKHKFNVYLKNPPLEDLPQETENWKYKVIPMEKMWTVFRLPLQLLSEKPKPDVFFSPGHYAPLLCPCPLVTMGLDTAYLDFPKYFKPQDLAQLKSWTKRSVNRANHVIAISQHTKNDILKHYNKFDQQVTVAHMGIDHQHFFFPQSDADINRIKSKYKIPGDYILYVGTLQPRKNLPALIEAFKITIEKRKGTQANDDSLSFENFKLVITGKKGWLYDEIFAKVKELQMEDQVIFTDYVPDEDLPALMAGARCLALVALYEGFGIPVIEALAVGTPAVVSKVSSLPEILGHAGDTCDPQNVEDIADKLGKMLDLNSEEYYKLVEKGIEHAALFSWDKTGRTVLKVLEHVGGLPT